MKKIKVIHQVLDPSGAGGVSSEFRALKKSKLRNEYEFKDMILEDFHRGISYKDIRYYYNFIKETDVDIVHIRGAAIDGLNAIIASKMARKGKILVTVHGMYSDLCYISKLKRWISKNIVERLSFCLADGISCVCYNAKNRDYFKKYSKKMLPFVYNRMPEYDLTKKEMYRNEIRKKYSIDNSTVVGLYVGRVTKEKGLANLLDAFLSLKDKWPDNFKFLIVGDGDYRLEMKHLAKELKDKVLFAGNQRDVIKYYCASDFFVLPSLHENHSISLLEACAAKIPSIATDCGGNNEIISNQENGILVPINNVRKLVESILVMCDEKTRKMYENNLIKTDFSKFTNDSVDQMLKDVYVKIMEK